MNALTPITRAPDTFEIIALDSEGSGALGDFVTACAYDKDGAHVFKRRDDVAKWLFSRRNLGKLIVCANLEYDYATLFAPFDEHFVITLANRKWLTASYRDGNKHTWKAIDLQRIAPMSVSQMGDVIGLPKLPTPPALVNDKKYKPPEWTCEAHGRRWCIECYCMRDAEITYRFALLLQDTLNALGGELKPTLASVAMDLFRRRFLHDEIPMPTRDHNDLARFAYYGGRVEAFKVGTLADVKAYDINSLYPYVMRDLEVIDASTLRRTDRPKNPYRFLDYEGILFGDVRVHDDYLGVLPFRSDGRLYFPTGRIRGAWTLSEVRHALDNGAELCDVQAILYARRTVRPFRQWVETLYRLRREYKEQGNPSQVIVKILLNSLYGKFGQREDGNLQRLTVPDYADGQVIKSGSEIVILSGNEAILSSVRSPYVPEYINVFWAAEITARARMTLYDYLAMSPFELAYCDTDSIHLRGVLPVSNELGGLKLEYDFGRVTYYRPKEYGGVTVDGRAIHRAKGIPPSFRAEYLERGRATYLQPVHTLTAIRTGLRVAEWQPVTKARHDGGMNRSHLPLTSWSRWTPTFPFDAGLIAP